jgi:ubiquinone biosynthesis protein UbiJ
LPDVVVNGAPKPGQIIREQLARYLGPFTAANAVKMFAKQALSTDPDHVTNGQVPALLEALGPMLRTLLGKEGAQNVLDQVRREVEKAG